MDPDANLEEQLDLARTILEADDDDQDADPMDASRLAELVIALNRWISNGGFLPDRWTK